LRNALRYVPAGGSVVVRLDASGDVWSLSVTDDGPGIPAGDVARVFDRFYRADPSRTDGGSGLGLAIVQEIIARHGGAVRAENAPDGGAVFRVELPRLP
ncbi:MAG: sensor histidine kinase, partial [Gemmatimonadetes bacterium]|nr:sensor histidine kinase [Gemmatimonadota bacterium]